VRRDYPLDLETDKALAALAGGEEQAAKRGLAPDPATGLPQHAPLELFRVSPNS